MKNDPVLASALAKIRTVMPHIIANQILSVQPMSNSIGNIFNMKSEITYIFSTYRRRVNPAIYNAFLRLNNRRKIQSDADFAVAGYHVVINILWDQIPDALLWCDSQFGKHGYYFHKHNNWWFVSEVDATLFKMAWK